MQSSAIRMRGYYHRALTSGLLTVNGRAATVQAIVGPSDIIRHSLHRHEPPITADAVDILHEDTHLLVINKPASIAIHPCHTTQRMRTHSC